MEIKVKTDFNVGDTIHYMQNDKPTYGKVRSIGIECDSEGATTVKYTTEKYDYIRESKAYPTAYDLRDDLFQVEEK